MKFTVQRDEFYQGVSATQRGTATRVIQPILSNILIQSLPEGRLQLSATDLDFGIETWVQATIETPGRITISAKKLAEIVSKLPSGSQITFDIDLETQTAAIQCGSSHFDIRTLPADEFPVIKPIDADHYFELDLKALVRTVNQTAFAAASYESNNVLGGVYFKLTADALEMAATDGSRLARCQEQVTTQNVTEEISAIIPVKALQEFVKLVSVSSTHTEDEKIRLAIQDGQISFRTDTVYVVSRLLDGQYPQYQQLIPDGSSITAYADKASLITSLERASVMANERTHVVKLSFENGNLSLAANTPEVGDSKDTIEARFDGAEPLNIAFNYKFLLDALRVIESDDVRMETNGALAPTLFKDKDRNNFLCLVMPVQVK